MTNNQVNQVIDEVKNMSKFPNENGSIYVEHDDFMRIVFKDFTPGDICVRFDRFYPWEMTEKEMDKLSKWGNHAVFDLKQKMKDFGYDLIDEVYQSDGWARKETVIEIYRKNS